MVVDEEYLVTEVEVRHQSYNLIFPKKVKGPWLDDCISESSGEQNEKCRKHERKRIKHNRGINRNIPRHGNNNAGRR